MTCFTEVCLLVAWGYYREINPQAKIEEPLAKYTAYYRCSAEEININSAQSGCRAISKPKDRFWVPCGGDDECPVSNTKPKPINWGPINVLPGITLTAPEKRVVKTRPSKPLPTKSRPCSTNTGPPSRREPLPAPRAVRLRAPAGAARVFHPYPDCADAVGVAGGVLSVGHAV